MYLQHGGKDNYQFEHSDEEIGAIFSKHPSWVDKKISKEQLRDLPNEYVTEDEAGESDEVGKFYLSYIDFQRTRHPIHALETFVNAFKAGINPPITVQKYLANAFQNFLASEGEVKLDTAIGFKNNKTSARRYFLNKRMEKRNQTIIHFLSKLQFFFPQIPDEKIFVMVSEAIKDEIEHDTLGQDTYGILWGYKKGRKSPLSTERIKEIYYEFQKGEDTKKYFREQEEWGDLDIDLSLEAKKNLLNKIPLREIPSDLKYLHRDHKKPSIA